MAGESIKLSFGVDDLLALSDTFGKRLDPAIKSAYKASIKRALITGRAFAARIYKDSYPGAKVGEIKSKYIYQKTNFEGGSIQNYEASLYISERGVELTALGARKTRAGASFASQSGRSEVKSAFLARMPNQSSEHWFIRKKIGDDGKRVGRLPIKKVFGPAPYTVFKFDGPRDEVASEMADSLAKNLESQIPYYLSKELKGL